MVRSVQTCPSVPAPAATSVLWSCAEPGRSRLLPLLAAALLVAAPAALEATTYNLATSVDDAVANGNCTLREALRAATTNAPVDACPPGGLNDAIVLPNGTYPFSGEEAVSGSGTLSITGATLNPFNVTVNLANAGRFVSLTGGGAYTIAGIEFTNGSAVGTGGAIYAENVALTIFNFRFVSNYGGGAGGALRYFADDSVTARALVVRNGAFLSNSTSAGILSYASGGGASVTIQNGNDADFRDVVFTSNTAGSTSSAGGGLDLFADGSGSVASCVRCNFGSNSTTANLTGSASGGAAALGAGNNARLTVRDGRFIGNSASSGLSRTAVLYATANSGANIDLDRLFIDANGGTGGGPDVTLVATTNALVWMVDSQLTYGVGNGVAATVESGGNLRLGHLTIADYPGDGATFTGTVAGPTLLQNSLVTFNAGNDLVDADGALAQSGNSIGGDPLFVNEPLGDYHLASGSPVIDAGNAGALTQRLADLDHGSRQVGLGPDMGCYEFGSLFADGFDVGDPGSWSGVVP